MKRRNLVPLAVLFLLLVPSSVIVQSQDDDWQLLGDGIYYSNAGDGVRLRFGPSNGTNNLKIDFEYNLDPDDRFTSNWIKVSVTIHAGEKYTYFTIPASHGKKSFGGARKFCVRLVGYQYDGGPYEKTQGEKRCGG